MTFKHIRLVTLVLLPFALQAQVTQINIPRIEQMPNEPAPYNVRDWRQVAQRYDSFVYDLQKTGQFLPLSYLKSSGVNYPQYPSFGLHTYVGTNSPMGNEAINVLPSLVGASLVGIDKSDQFGRNWVRMSQDFFNKNNGELLYLNNPSTSTGNDWWYDLMPNVFFYQLYDLYPNVGGDADYQFTTIADRFHGAVKAMGGSAAPWQKPYMNYRAWNFKTNQANTTSVPEPEAAGAYAWVLYNAYKKTGNPTYLQGAEWSLEFLSDWGTNPSYELQLPYGTYTAARMNAELGTKYNIEKMVNWSFNRGDLRGWGTIVGTWGGFNVSGLVGEANDNGNDYAFQLNGVQQAAMLAPMVRYDKRFARAIGKWVLNLTNATRLFYPGYLPNSLQDASAWSNANDPERVIGYEALREKYQGNAPYSTGDALNGGWAGTNLSLYSTGSIGYLGAIVEKTNVDKILKIDLLKTDFYHETAYPTYLLFNPYNVSKSVALPVGNTPVDVYDAISATFLLQNGTGTVNLNIPANAALLVTLTPTGGVLSYDRNKMLVNGVVVDYNQTAVAFKYAPRIQALAATTQTVEFSDSTAVFSKTFDQDSNNFTWTWSATGGTISGTGANIFWKAPLTAGNYTITLIVADESGQRDTATLQLQAVAEINLAPQTSGIQKSTAYTTPGGTVELTCPASDPNNDPLIFTWSGGSGTFAGSGNTVTWTAPGTPGIYTVNVTVADDEGLTAQATTTILVKNFTATTGNLIAWYPFSNNGNDISGNQLNGQVNGALFVPDFWGNATRALRFDGLNDFVNVPNNTLLNFQDGITVSCWFKAGAQPDHETFLVSHGSWQNRWKISITPEGRIRWTVNTLTTIADLDLDVPVAVDSIYQVAATYDGTLLALYLNGQLRTYKFLTGKIRTAAIPLLIGQILPGTQDFNFKGVIDEVKIYDYALTPPAVQTLYSSIPTAVQEVATASQTLQVSPNPVLEILTVRLSEIPGPNTQVAVFDLHGKLVETQKSGAEGSFYFNTKNWKSGIYIAQVQSNTPGAAVRFVKL